MPTLYSASRISSISRPLNGETTLDLVVAYHKANLRTFLSQMARPNEEQQPKANSYPW